MLMLGSKASRVVRLARSERISPDQLEDSVRGLALRYPLTEAEVYDVVEAHGLKHAQARIEESIRGEG